MRLTCTVIALTASFAFAADTPDKHWPRWRGPNDDGAAVSGDYRSKFGPGSNLAWKVELPGKGCSTPAVWGDTILVTAPIDGEDAVLAFDWSGKKLWQAKLGKETRGKHRNGSGANASPITDGKLVFVYYKSGTLAALDLTGKVKWKTNLQQTFGKVSLYWDAGTSPVLTEKLVVVPVMHQGDSYVVAYDKQSGDQVWKTERNYDVPVECDHAYTTPTVVKRDGKERVVVWGAEHLTTYDAATGKMLWSAGEFNPQKRGNWVQVASATVIGDMVVIPFGRGSRLAGVKLGGSGDVTKTHRTWTRNDTGGFVPTAAAHGGKAYLLRDAGEVVCVNPADGTTVWSGKFPKGRGKYYSSPVIAGGKLYAAREDGALMVASIDGKFSFLNENDMGERLIAAPVPVAGRLLVRGEKHLFCVERP